jgi:hypothetical protein
VPRGITRTEFASIEKRFRPVEEVLQSVAPLYARRAYALAITQAYIRAILRNQSVAGYVSTVHPTIHRRLRSVQLRSS